MPRTNMALEVQIAQEYTGQNVDLCWLAPDWKRALDFDTRARGPGSSVRRVVDGSLFQQTRAGIVGVANVGNDANWMGNHLAVANLYAFGRLAWNPGLPPRDIAAEWTRLTFGNDPGVAGTVSRMLLASHAVYERYTSPFGLNVLAGRDHFEPDPAGRASYHHADAHGVGYDRTVRTGSGYAGQYFPPVARRFEFTETTPDDLLLFFHHVPYTHRMHGGKTVLQAIVDAHNAGVEQVKELRAEWIGLKGRIDAERYEAVLLRFDQQVRHAERWRDAVNGYFEMQSAK
jgi:alpha-glucuronidase